MYVLGPHSPYALLTSVLQGASVACHHHLPFSVHLCLGLDPLCLPLHLDDADADADADDDDDDADDDDDDDDHDFLSGSLK